MIQLAEMWVAAKDDLESRQAFINTCLAQVFSARAGKPIEESAYINRREKFGDKLDLRVLRLFCEVDHQDDRLEAHVIGIGYPEEFWSVDYHTFYGDLAKPEIWQELLAFLRSAWPHPLGGMKISASCVNSGGHFTEQVYNFCRPRGRENIWAIKSSSWSRTGDPVWLISKSRVNRAFGFKPQILNIDSAKDYMRAVLLNEEPGAGYLHIPLERSDAWMAQLFASETPIYEKKHGITTRRWSAKKGAANEAWDTLLYAYAAYCGMKAVRGFNLERAAQAHGLMARSTKQ